MLKSLIVDDERPARLRLKRLLSKFPEIEVIGEAGDGHTALTKIDNLAPDVVFLDIEMPILNGLEVAQAVTKPCHIVFVTAYDQFAINAFDLCAADYLLKPLAEQRLAATVTKLANSVAKENDNLSDLMRTAGEQGRLTRLALPIDTGYKIVPIREISAVIAGNQYEEVFFAKEKLLVNMTLDQLDRQLSRSLQFKRIHRSAIINTDYVDRLERLGDRKYLVHLTDFYQNAIPVSRDRLNSLKSSLGI